MTIKQQGGIFGRNPSFNDLEAEQATVNGRVNIQSNRPQIFLYEQDRTDNNARIEVTGDNLRFSQVDDENSSVVPRVILEMDTGNFTVNDGNLVIGTSGKGIDFSVTSGTGTSELFSDYEEGTFTPVVGGTSSAGTYTYGTQSGVYTKVGDLVTVTINLVDITASVAGSGVMEISGLPFSASGTHVGSVWARSINFDNSAAYLVPYISGSDIYINEVVDNASGSSVNIADITSGSSRLYITLTYKV